MRVTISELEACRSDVAGWVRNKLNPTGGGPRFGYASAIRYSIYHYHKTNSPDKTRAHLRELLDRFRSADLRFAAEAELDQYLQWCKREQPIVAACKVRLNLPLSGDVTLGGEVSRLDLDLSTGGYRAVLLGSAPAQWQEQLRMPLIQRALARATGRNESELRVGFQALDGSGLTLVQYTAGQLTESEGTARSLAARLAAEWAAQGGGPP